MADDTFNNDNQESLMGDDEFTEVEATVIEEGDEGERAQTVNGWIIINCGRIPEIGETLLIDGLSVEIIKTDGTKIIEAKISKIPDEE